MASFIYLLENNWQVIWLVFIQLSFWNKRKDDLLLKLAAQMGRLCPHPDGKDRLSRNSDAGQWVCPLFV